MNTFEKIIKDYVEKFAQGDAVFASKYEKSGKDIEGCCKYIKDEARKQAKNGCAVIADDEVFGWAVHYFDEEMTAPKGNVECKVGTTVNPDAVRAKVADTPKKAVSLANEKPKAPKEDECQLSLF